MAENERIAVAVPDALQPYVESAVYALGHGPADGVSMKLTREGVKYARRNHNQGSHELARWLMAQPLWQGRRTQNNVADEISTHALYVDWPLLGKRANPVDLEYFENWPVSLLSAAWDRLLSTLRRHRRR